MAIKGKDYVVGLIIFTAVLTAGMQIGNEVFTSHNVPVDNQKLNQLKDLRSETNASTGGMLSTAKRNTKNIGADIADNVFILGTAWQGLKTIYTAATFAPQIPIVISQVIPLPGWFVNMASGIILALGLYLLLNRYGGA